MEAKDVFQVRAQEEPSGTSHTHLFILFPLNNRTSDKELKPCVFSNKAYREGVRGAKKDGVFSPSSSSGFIEGWECNTLTRIFYRFNILPQHLVDPHGKERASRKITLVAFFAHLQLPNQNYIFLDLQWMKSSDLFSGLVTMFKEHNGPQSLTRSLIYSTCTVLKIVSEISVQESHAFYQKRCVFKKQRQWCRINVKAALMWRNKKKLPNKKITNRNPFSRLTLISSIKHRDARSWSALWQSGRISSLR